MALYVKDSKTVSLKNKVDSKHGAKSHLPQQSRQQGALPAPDTSTDPNQWTLEIKNRGTVGILKSRQMCVQLLKRNALSQLNVCLVTLLIRRSMRCRVLCSGGRMLWVEEMVLWGLSCSMFVRRLWALGPSLLPLSSSVEMYRLSFSLLRTRLIPPLFFGGGLGFAARALAFSQASVASWNSIALRGSSNLTKTTSLLSIMKSLCEDRSTCFSALTHTKHL